MSVLVTFLSLGKILKNCNLKKKKFILAKSFRDCDPCIDCRLQSRNDSVWGYGRGKFSMHDCHKAEWEKGSKEHAFTLPCYAANDPLPSMPSIGAAH